MCTGDDGRGGLIDGQDGGDDVRHLRGQHLFNGVVDGLDPEVIDEWLTALAGAVDEDHLTIGVFGESLEVFVAPHAGPANYGGAIFSSHGDSKSKLSAFSPPTASGPSGDSTLVQLNGGADEIVVAGEAVVG